MGEAEDAVRRRLAQQQVDAAAELNRKCAAIPGLITDVLTLLKNADFAGGELITISQTERPSAFSRARLVEREIAGWQIAEYSVTISVPYKGTGESRQARIWLLSDGRFAGDHGQGTISPFAPGWPATSAADARAGKDMVERVYRGLTKLQSNPPYWSSWHRR